jgi:hypothetical protein
MRNTTEKLAEKFKTQIFYPITFFPENPALYEIMWKNVVDPGRTQMAI